MIQLTYISRRRSPHDGRDPRELEIPIWDSLATGLRDNDGTIIAIPGNKVNLKT